MQKIILMVNFSKQYRVEVIVLFVFTIIFCISLSLMRVACTGSHAYLFLNWNLILAIIPLLLSSYLLMFRKRINRYSFMALAFLWLIFFPNSPYILTDLFHLHHLDGMPTWYDLIMILAFAWAGMLFGFCSLLQIEKILLEKLSPFWTQATIFGLLFLASFGVYIGRYVRLNSWHIFSEPHAVFFEIIDRFLHPLAHGRTWGLTLLMGSLLSIIFFSIKTMQRIGHQVR